MDLITIALNERSIAEDGAIDLDKANTEIIELFVSNDCEIVDKKGNTTVWTRKKDSKDSEVIWQVQSVLAEKDWFRYYVSTWRYAATADDSDKIIEEGDILEEWDIQRPENIKNFIEYPKIPDEA